MTDLIDRAKKALEGVTDGPWGVGATWNGFGYVFDVYAGDEEIPVVEETYNQPNARFIAAARTLIPELIAALEEREGK